MTKFRTLDDLDVRGKRVLLRADLNVAMKNGIVTDTTRIDRLAPTIETLLDKGAKVIVMSHFGRPKGTRDPAFSLRPLVAPLSRAIGGRDVAFAEDCTGEKAKRVVSALRPGQVALLETDRTSRIMTSLTLPLCDLMYSPASWLVDDIISSHHERRRSVPVSARCNRSPFAHHADHPVILIDDRNGAYAVRCHELCGLWHSSVFVDRNHPGRHHVHRAHHSSSGLLTVQLRRASRRLALSQINPARLHKAAPKRSLIQIKGCSAVWTSLRILWRGAA